MYIQLLQLAMQACTKNEDCQSKSKEPICENSMCDCKTGITGYGDDLCTKQYCSNQDGRICMADELYKSECVQKEDSTEWTCKCATEPHKLKSTGFTCVVENPTYLDNTISYIFLGIGCFILLLCGCYIGYQYYKGVDPETYQLVDGEQAVPPQQDSA